MAKEKKPIRGVYEKAPGSDQWWIRYSDSNGKIRREYVGLRTAATNLYRKRKTEVREGKKLPENFRKPAVTFKDLATDALIWSKANKRDWSHDDSRINKLLPDFGYMKAEDITPREIEAWLAANTDTPATANRYRAVLSLCYRQGIRNDRVKVNPARAVSMKAENNGRIRYLKPEEETRIRAAIRAKCPEHLPVFVFALNTGLRAGEMFNVKWEDIDLDRRQLTVPKSKHGGTRHVSLNLSARAVLRLSKRKSLGSPFVFENWRGQKLSKEHRWFSEVLEVAEVESFRWHDLRHTFCSRLTMAGVGLRTVQQLAGHKTIQMTSRYAHLSQDSELEALDVLSKYQRAMKAQTDTRTDTKQKTRKRAA